MIHSQMMAIIEQFGSLRTEDDAARLDFTLDALQKAESEDIRDFLRSLLVAEYLRLNRNDEAIEIALERSKTRPDSLTFVALSETYHFAGRYNEAIDAAHKAVDLASKGGEFGNYSSLNLMRLLIELKDFLALNSYIDSLIVAPGGFGQAVGADCQMEWDWAAGAIKLGVDPDKIEELKRLSGVAQK